MLYSQPANDEWGEVRVYMEIIVPPPPSHSQSSAKTNNNNYNNWKWMMVVGCSTIHSISVRQAFAESSLKAHRLRCSYGRWREEGRKLEYFQVHSNYPPISIYWIDELYHGRFLLTFQLNVEVGGWYVKSLISAPLKMPQCTITLIMLLLLKNSIVAKYPPTTMQL